MPELDEFGDGDDDGCGIDYYNFGHGYGCFGDGFSDGLGNGYGRGAGSGFSFVSEWEGILCQN